MEKRDVTTAVFFPENPSLPYSRLKLDLCLLGKHWH